VAQPKRRLSSAEAASYIGLDRRTLENWRCKSMGPTYYRISRKRIIYDRDELEQWLQARKVATNDCAVQLATA
jgi:hypothetical protein